MDPMDKGADTLIRLDLRGYRCPAPVIRLEAALRKAPPGASVSAASSHGVNA